MDGQLRPTVAEDARWVLTAAEGECHRIAEEGVLGAAAGEVDPTVVAVGMLPRRVAAEGIAAAAVEAITDTGKLQI